MSFKRISTTDARKMMAEASDDVQIVDIRDDESYAAGHIEAAFHLHNSNLQQFIAEADPDKPLLVYCYHGHMSQGAAAYLAEQGFAEAYSLDGGFQAWSEEESAD
jgi:thiosulfate sulfurtransferase